MMNIEITSFNAKPLCTVIMRDISKISKKTKLVCEWLKRKLHSIRTLLMS